MTALRASHILKQLDAHAVGQQMQALAALDTNHRDEVRRALSAVGPRATIDLPILLSTIEREVAERQARQPDTPCWPWAVQLMTDSQLAEFKRLVEGGTDADEAARTAMASASPASPWATGDLRALPDDVEPDPDLDDDEPDTKPRRRSIPRLRSRRLIPKPKAKSKQREPMTFGPAVFDEHGRINAEYGFTPMRPPWLLSDGSDDELEGEDAA